MAPGGAAGVRAPRRAPPGKVLLLIIDGVGDVSIPAFGDRTPLQVAHTPNLDAIAGARRRARRARGGRRPVRPRGRQNAALV